MLPLPVFYMMTQTILSAATLVCSGTRRATQEGRGLIPFINDPEPRHPTRPTGLVAQALLPVRACYTDCEEPLQTAASLRSEMLIANLELEFHLTRRRISLLRISNRKFSALLHLQLPSPSGSMSANESSAARHSSLCVLIYGSAIKSRRKPFENTNLQISNRR